MQKPKIERRAYSFPLLGTRRAVCRLIVQRTQDDVLLEANPPTLTLLGFAEEIKDSAREVIWAAFQEPLR